MATPSLGPNPVSAPASNMSSQEADQKYNAQHSTTSSSNDLIALKSRIDELQNNYKQAIAKENDRDKLVAEFTGKNQVIARIDKLEAAVPAPEAFKADLEKINKQKAALNWSFVVGSATGVSVGALAGFITYLSKMK